MAESLRLAWAIARSGWLATYNRTWRFSKIKSALIFNALHLGFILFVSRRAGSSAALGGPGAVGLDGLIALMTLQMAWFGLFYGFARGQFQLYRGLLVPLFQIAPARPLGMLLGRVLESVPARAWSCLLWAWAYSAALSGRERAAAVILLATVGLLAGMAGHLSGLLGLSLWARVSPRGMRNGLFIGFAVTLGIFTWSAIFLAGGGTIAELAVRLRAARGYLFSAVAVLAGLPGLGLFAALFIRPEAVENLYRDGVYRVIEAGEQADARPSRSRWLPWPSGVARAVLSREWLMSVRSEFARVGLLTWLAGTVGVYAAGRAVAGQPVDRAVVLVGGLSLLAWGLPFSSRVVGAFESERVTIMLYRIAGVAPARLLAAKFAAAVLPALVLVGLSLSAGAWAARLDAVAAVRLFGWTLLALLAGSLAGFGVAAATAGEEPDEPEVAAAPRGGGPSTVADVPWALARIVGLVAPIALGLWTGGGRPGAAGVIPAALPLAIVMLLPVGAIVVGYRLMTREGGWDA